MKLLNTLQIRDCDAYTIKNEPILSVDLMERAARQLAKWFDKHVDSNRAIYFLVGPGNNGGDALALARLLYHNGFSNLNVFLLQISSTPSADWQINLSRLYEIKAIRVLEFNKSDAFPEFAKHGLIVDGIFGSGLSREIEGYWADFICHVNANDLHVVSIDIPSGLFADSHNSTEGAIIKAMHTLTFQFPKMAFLFAENEVFVGDWEVLDIGLHPGFISQVETLCCFLEKDMVKELYKKRIKFAHKGHFGHAFLVAGSYQKTGAAVLAAKACMRSGVGLLTVHVPQSAYSVLQTAVPEAMLCIDETEMNYCEPKVLNTYNVLGIGPGIGIKQSMQVAFEKLIRNSSHPLVADADALNILAMHPEWLKKLPENSILTPHPGEFDRLTHKHNSAFERFETQRTFSKVHRLIIVLKGAYTSITLPDGQVYFNSTGNPGMATAGSGDVLTGIILALLAQKYLPHEAAIMGVYLHGLSGDFARNQMGEEALIASDIILNLGKAFATLAEQ
jgi:NAD(P)H-hydrate epimerase